MRDLKRKTNDVKNRICPFEIMSAEFLEALFSWRTAEINHSIVILGVKKGNAAVTSSKRDKALHSVRILADRILKTFDMDPRGRRKEKQ